MGMRIGMQGNVSVVGEQPVRGVVFTKSRLSAAFLEFLPPVVQLPVRNMGEGAGEIRQMGVR